MMTRILKTSSMGTHPAAFVDKPKDITGPASTAWDYLVNRGGVSKITDFDNDFEPAGPQIRSGLLGLGCKQSTSGGLTIIFLPLSH